MLDVNSNRQLKAFGTKGTNAPYLTKASKSPKGGKAVKYVKADDALGTRVDTKSTKKPDAMKASKAPKGGKSTKSVKADDALSTRMDTKNTKSSESQNIAKTVRSKTCFDHVSSFYLVL